MSILSEGQDAAAVEHQSGFCPRRGLVRDLCDEIERLTEVARVATRSADEYAMEVGKLRVKLRRYEERRED